MTEYRLIRPRPAPAEPPVLDPSQRAVVDHGRGHGPAAPLLVLAGPGTGKTTTVVELVAERVAAGEIRPDQVLMLTFSRKAAAELRHRVAARVGAAGSPVTAMTFHSWCYAQVRRAGDPAAVAGPPVLMTAAESDAVLADLLAGHDADTWPAPVRPGLRTRGFAAEVGRFLGVSATGRLTTDDLRRRSDELDRPLWRRVADVLDEYAEITDAQNLTDYAELVIRTSALLDDPVTLDSVRADLRLVVVDEYQDTDPAQIEVLRKLVGPAQQLVAVGDHDQSIYGFRGADANAVTRFREHFGGAEVRALTTTRRFGPRIRDAAVAVLPPGQPGGLPVDVVRSHRDLVCHPDAGTGTVEVLTFTSDTAEVEHVAELLRRQHLEQGRSWSDMAVLVRTSAQLARLQRALGESDVPCEVAGDEIPLVAEPAVRSLLGALGAADTLAAGGELEPDVAGTLLTGPLAGVDAPDLRALARRLRADDRETPSAVLLARAVTGLGSVGDVTDPTVARLSRLLARAAQMVTEGASPEQVLWVLWDGTEWPQRLMRAWEAGGPDRVAVDRDLDAIVALFHHAARSEERRRHRSVASFLADLYAQELPVDRWSGSTSRPDAVSLLTAHRAKGLEWPVVVVAGVQEDLWPDLAARPSLLRPDLLLGEAPTSRDRLHEERRLFYVALTRAREHLVVTAVHGGGDDATGPSRFVSELRRAGFGDDQRRGRPPRPLSVRSLVTQLRQAADHPDPAVRASAATLLARVAAHRTPRARAAHPDTWWGLRDSTESPVPLRDPDEPLALSGSGLTTITGCSLRWFLSHEAQGSRGSTTSQGFGLIVHAIAADVVRRSLTQSDEPAPTVAELQAHLDGVWHRLGHETAWISERDRVDAHQALTRFATWHAENSRTPIAAEHEFTAQIQIDGETVVLRGSMDRVELDADGRVHVIDFKNQKKLPAAAEVLEHAQLGVYQLAVREAGVHGHHEVGGSELVQLRAAEGAKRPDAPRVQAQPAPAEGDFFVHELLGRAVRTMRREEFAATPSTCSYCEFEVVCPATTTFTIGSGG